MLSKIKIFLLEVPICLLVLLASVQVFAQKLQVKTLDELLSAGQADAKQVMDLDAFVAIILANHPVVKQAELLPENARQALRLAKGAFDPKLEATWNIKQFRNKRYYDIFNTTLEVPTWFPLDPKISIDRNRGVFLNPENAIPGSDNFRQITAGLSLPIGRGLLIDQRRAVVRQARLFMEITAVERIKMINKVLLSAIKDFWNWYFTYYNYLLIKESLNISQEIYRRVKVDFEFGELAAVDTVQAAITLQNRRVDQQEALISFKRAGLTLSNYLWGENEEPLEINEKVYPPLDYQVSNPGIRLDSLMNLAIEQHPDLRKASLKISQLNVAERLARENLKPQIDLNYNLINAPLGAGGDLAAMQLRNNYKFGVSFQFPLFLRKERSKLKQTQIKIAQTRYQLSQREREVRNSIQASYFELSNTRQMLDLMQQAVDNYKTLLDAELFNLEIGESDLFKINFQQDKLLEAQIKLMKTRTNLEKARVVLYWSAGIPYLNFVER